MWSQKMYKEDLNSPCEELSNGDLEIVVTLLVCWKIDFSCVSRGYSIQLYDSIVYRQEADERQRWFPWLQKDKHEDFSV